MKNIFHILLLLIILCCWSCRKEADDRTPVVEIWQPADNAIFTVGDSILVAGMASDETALQSLQITLTDDRFIVKDYFLSIQAGSNPLYFSEWYVPTNMQLPDGDYYIQVRATDGVNTKYKYKPIRLTRGSADLKNLLVIISEAPGSFSLNTLDATGQDWQHLETWQHLYAGSGVSEVSEQIYLIGRGFGECYALDMEDYTLDFKLQQAGTPSLFYHENLIAGGHRFYIGLTDGYIHGFNKLGVQQFSASLTEHRKPGLMALHKQEYLIVAERQTAGPGSWIASYFLNTGAKWAEYKLPDGSDVTAITSPDNDRILISLNINDTGRLTEWNIAASSISTPLQLQDGRINDMLPISSTNILLAHDDEILIYNTISQTAMPFLQHQGTIRLRHDPKSQTLFAATTSSISAFNLNTKTMLWQKTIAGALKDFHLRVER